MVCLTAYGHCVGLTRAGWQHGPRISLFSPAFDEGRGYVEDIVIHEMLHAWLYVNGLNMAHDGEPWYAALRRLSPEVLGRDLDVRRGGDRRSVRRPNPRAGEEGQPATVVRKIRVEDAVSHDEVSRWPHPFRPATWSPGEPIECPTY